MLIFLQGIQDWKLLLGVTCLVAFDLVILIVFTVVEGLRGNLGPGLEESQENLQDVDGVCNHFAYSHFSLSFTGWPYKNFSSVHSADVL